MPEKQLLETSFEIFRQRQVSNYTQRLYYSGPKVAYSLFIIAQSCLFIVLLLPKVAYSLYYCLKLPQVAQYYIVVYCPIVVPIPNFSDNTQCNDNSKESFLLFYYYGAIIYIVNQNFERACLFLEIVSHSFTVYTFLLHSSTISLFHSTISLFTLHPFTFCTLPLHTATLLLKSNSQSP